MKPKLERSAIERHPVFCPSANSWSTSGSEASLSDPLIAMLAVLLDQAVGDVRPIPHHLLAALHAAQAGDHDPAGARAARAPRLARLSFQHVASQPGGERHVLRRGRADDSLQHGNEAAHGVDRAIGEIIEQRGVGRRPRHQPTRSPSMAAISSSMNAWVERHATTAPRARASSSPIAFNRWVFPSPLLPTRTSGLYFFPGRSITSRTALTATSFDGPTA